MMRIGKFGVILCSILLSSCSLIEFAYNNAPRFVASEIDDAFQLTEIQSAELDGRLEQWFSWHRQHELQRYHELLERAAVVVADGIEADAFLELIDEARKAWLRAVDQAIDGMVDLAATLDKAQIERYQRYHRDASEDYADYLELSVQQREIVRVNRNLGRLEKWFGEFDYYQKQKTSALLLQLPDLYEDWYRFRESRHQALTLALTKAATDGFTGQDLKTILYGDSDYAREFEQARRAYWQAYATALADISNWLTKAQRQRAISKLRKYARLVERLHLQT